VPYMQPLASLRRWLLIPVLVLAALSLAAGPAAAETEIDVSTVADDWFQPGRPVPLVVSIRSDQAVEGTLSVSTDGRSLVSQQIELPGGSTKDFTIVTPTIPWSTSMVVTFKAEDESQDSTGRINLRSPGSDELVGVLGSLADDLPEKVDMTVPIGEIRLAAIEPELIDFGIDGLAMFNQVVVNADDLARLSPEQLDTVRNWVGIDSGVLVVDEAPGTPLAVDIDSGTVDEDQIRFGSGTIMFTNGEIAAGGLDGVLRPSRSRSFDDFPNEGGFGGPSGLMKMAGDAGIRLIPINNLIFILLAYVVVVGPVLWLVLRKYRSQPSVWLITPALALVVAAGVYGVGLTLRDAASSAHTTIVADTDTARISTSQVLLTSRGGGQSGLKLEPNWGPFRAPPTEDQFFFENEEIFFEEVEAIGVGPGREFGGPVGGSSFQGQASQVGDELLTTISAGGFAVVSAEHVGEVSDTSWEFDVAFNDDGKLVGELTNTSGHDLESVLVAAGAGSKKIASVKAGETVELTINRATTRPLQFDPLFEQLWQGDPWAADDKADNPAAFMNWLNRRQSLRADGVVMAVGWTKDLAAPLATIDGNHVVDGRTAFASFSSIDINGAPAPEFLRGWSTNVDDTFNQNQCWDMSLTAALTPPKDATSDMVMDIDANVVLAMDVWDGDEWIQTGITDAQGDVALGLPPATIGDGRAYIRVVTSCEAWDKPVIPTIRAATSSDDVVQLGDTFGEA